MTTIEREIKRTNGTNDKLIAFKLITYPGCDPCRFYVSEYGDVYDAVKDAMVYQRKKIRGYEVVKLNNKFATIHRLVAWEFHPDKRDMKLTIDHIDGNKLNNHYTNLEWVTVDENIRRSYARNSYKDAFYKFLVSYRKEKEALLGYNILV